jgi:diacylglycerol kinase family enzyme
MKQLPYAEASDGLLDFTVIHNRNKLAAISNIKKLYDGSIIELSWVDVHKAKEIDIIPNQKMLIEVDGESIGYGPFHFSLIDRAVSVIVGKKYRLGQ